MSSDSPKTPPSSTPEYRRAYYRAFYNSHPDYAQRKRDHMKERYHNNPEVRARVLQRVKAAYLLKKANKAPTILQTAPENDL